VPRRGEGSSAPPPKLKKAAAPVRPDDRAVRPVPPPAPRPVVGEGPKKPAVWARDRKVDEFARQVAAGRIQGRRGLEAVRRLGLSDDEKRRLQELTRQYSQETQRDVGRHLVRGTANAVASSLTLPTTGQTAAGTLETVRENAAGLEWAPSQGRQVLPADRSALVTQDVRGGVFPGFGRLFGPKAMGVAARAKAPKPPRVLLPSEEVLAETPYMRYIPIVRHRNGRYTIGEPGDEHWTLGEAALEGTQGTAVIENGRVVRVNFTPNVGADRETLPEELAYFVGLTEKFSDEALQAVRAKFGLPVVADADKITDALAQAKAGRVYPKQEALRTPERAARGERAARIAEQVGGAAGTKASRAALRGKFPEIQFNALKDHKVDQATVDQWHDYIESRHDLGGFYTRHNTKRSLDRVLAGKPPSERDYELLTNAFGPEKAAEIKAAVNAWKKGLNTTADLLNSPKAMKSSVDFSGLGRQALVAAAGHPVMAVRSTREALPAMFSQRKFEALQEKIASDPEFPLALRGRVSFTGIDEIDNMEDAFMSPIANKIPWVKMSNRGYVGVLNTIRLNLFKTLLQVNRSDGIDPANNLEALHKNGFWVNIATGRGPMPAEVRKWANIPLFSPSLISSRLNLLFNPTLYAGRGAAGRAARRDARRSMASLLATGSAILYGIHASGVGEVGLDPRSADFGKIKIGNTRIDMWGGMQQYIVAAYRTLKGEIVYSDSGEMAELEGNVLARGWKSGERLFEQKMSPQAGYVNAARKEETWQGKPFDPWKEAAKLALPIGVESAYTTQQEYGVGPAAGGFGLNFFGIGVNTYATPKGQRATQRAPEKPKDAPDEWMVKVARYLGTSVKGIPAELRVAREAQLSVQERQENLKRELGLRREPNTRQKAAIKIDVLVEKYPEFRQDEKFLRAQIKNPLDAAQIEKWLDEKLGYRTVEEWSRRANQAAALEKLSRVKVAK
jgi:hypothetical protein